jgi:hypothetical protein
MFFYFEVTSRAEGVEPLVQERSQASAMGKQRMWWGGKEQE